MRQAALATLLLLLAALAPARAESPDPPPVLAVPEGATVQLDGQVTDAEWERAATIPVGDEGATLRLLQRRGTLLLALTSPAPWPEGASLWLAFRRDDGGDAGLYADGAVRLDFEPREHNRPHLLAFRNVGGREVAIEEAPVARATADAPRSALEVAIPLETLGIDADDAPPLRMALLWMRGPRAGRLAWPGDLVLDAPPGRPPAGLASSEGWARIGGWRGVGQGGAFPRTEWDTWRSEDRELARRGMAAHGEALRIAEDPETPKKDEAVLEKVAANLQWIASREPLTPNDLLVWSKVLAFLNRTDEGLTLLDALASHPTWRQSPTRLYARARLLEAQDRWEEAAATWRALLPLSPPNYRPRYVAAARRAEEQAAAWAAERAARAQDTARSDLPLVLLRTTRGDVVLQLFANDVPKAVAHFLELVRRREDGRGFYDGTCFHRVIGGYLAQGGDPTSREDCEAAGEGKGPLQVEVEHNARHGFWRGAVGFARGVALENGAQFFLLTGSRPELGEDDFTCFGHVIAGMDVVDRLETGDRLLEARVLAAPAPASAAPPANEEK